LYLTSNYGWLPLFDEGSLANDSTEAKKAMKRRQFLKLAQVAGTTGAAATVAGLTNFPAPAIADTEPLVQWRLASSAPKSLETVLGAAELVAKRVSEATDHKFQIQTFAADEIVPQFQVLDAVGRGTVELGQSFSYYFVGKDPTFAFDAAVPWGLNTRQQMAWIYRGGGLELLRGFFKDHNIYNIPAGNTGAQMGGWFRNEIRSLEDLRGIKFRIGGWAGPVLSRIGVVPQQIPIKDIYPALEKGAIDAAEWVGPYDDEKFGFNRAARYYYYPGWWEGSTQFSVYVNLEQWHTLPKTYQAILELACAEAYTWTLAKYDVDNPSALRRLVAGGTALRAFSEDILEASYAAALALYAETAAKNVKFKRVYDSWKAYREDSQPWLLIAEFAYDRFAYTHPWGEQRN
jgi:TRAP-type mannitol/chloroaromatic compound transport system substrate-binding protein